MLALDVTPKDLSYQMGWFYITNEKVRDLYLPIFASDKTHYLPHQGSALWDMPKDCLRLDLPVDSSRAPKRTTIQDELVPKSGERPAPYRQKWNDTIHPASAASFNSAILAYSRKTVHESVE